MKKKLLSVLMAGALVATSSVNAFAATPNVTGLDNETKETEIKIEGNVANEQNHIKPGTLSVTVPTAATFRVEQSGDFSAPNIQVENHGNDDIDVFAYQFIDVNKTDGINIVSSSEDLSQKDRTHLTLNLGGNVAVAYFKTEAEGSDKKGVYKDAECNTPNADASGIKIARVKSGQSYEMTLNGAAGKNGNQVTEAKQDAFTLKLKIAKATDK